MYASGVQRMKVYRLRTAHGSKTTSASTWTMNRESAIRTISLNAWCIGKAFSMCTVVYGPPSCLSTASRHSGNGGSTADRMATTMSARIAVHLLLYLFDRHLIMPESALAVSVSISSTDTLPSAWGLAT